MDYNTTKSKMMKRVILCLVLVMSAPVGSVKAAPCYGTTMPLRHKIIGGLQSYRLIRRELEHDYGQMRSFQHFFMLSYGITDWFSLDGKIGTGNIKIRPEETDDLNYRSAFAGGYGFRIRLYQDETRRIKSVFGFQHISVHPYSKEGELGKNKAVLDDWQFSWLVSVRLRGVTPYLGTKWSRVDYIHWLNHDRKRVMSDLSKSVGLVAGIDIPLVKDKISLNLEGHYFDETAASCAVMYAF